MDQRYWVAPTLLLALVFLLGVAALTNTSKGPLTKSSPADTAIQQQILRCDDGDAISGDGAAEGETCEAGDWSDGLDCRGFTHLTVRHFEYNEAAGSSNVKVWDCVTSQGFGRPGAGGNSEATNPSGTPLEATPIPLCVDITAGAGVSIDGTTGAGGVRLFAPTPYSLNYIFIEMEGCSSCNSTTVVSCSR